MSTTKKNLELPRKITLDTRLMNVDTYVSMYFIHYWIVCDSEWGRGAN